MIKRLFTFILIFTWVLPLVCFAQDSQPFSGRVAVIVIADGNIQGKIKSYISRELRSLGDIIVTNDQPRWILNIIAHEMSTRGGYKSGIVLSIVLLEPFDKNVVLNNINGKAKKFISMAMPALHQFCDHGVRVGASQDLRKLCSDIVTHFDIQHIKPARAFWQKYFEVTRDMESELEKSYQASQAENK